MRVQEYVHGFVRAKHCNEGRVLLCLAQTLISSHAQKAML